MPSSGHSRGSGRAAIRSATYSTAGHISASNCVGWKIVPAPRANGVSAQAPAASAWAPRPPPNSRAISATSTTATAPAICPVARNAISDAPAVCTTSQPIHAVTGGKSTYPNAGWRAAARK